MLIDPVHALLTQSKRVLWQVLLRSAVTFALVWALGTLLVLAILLDRSRALPAPSTWMFVAGVMALPATIAGQLAGAITVLVALTRLAGSIMRLPQTLINQVSASVKDLPELAPLVRQGLPGGRGAHLSASLLSALGVALVSTLVTTRLQLPHEKRPVSR